MPLEHIKIKISFHFLPNLTGFKEFALPTMEDKSLWNTKVMPRIICVLQLKFALLRCCPLSSHNAMLREGRGWASVVAFERDCLFGVREKAQQKHKINK